MFPRSKKEAYEIWRGKFHVFNTLHSKGAGGDELKDARNASTKAFADWRDMCIVRQTSRPTFRIMMSA